MKSREKKSRPLFGYGLLDKNVYGSSSVEVRHRLEASRFVHDELSSLDSFMNMYCDG